jgi:hypothetical protein
MEVLKFERIEVISDPMRELIEDLWPGLALSLPKTRFERIDGVVCTEN